MKKQISPKDILFLSMLLLIVAVGYFGFSQSTRLKSKSEQQTSEIFEKSEMRILKK